MISNHICPIDLLGDGICVERPSVEINLLEEVAGEVFRLEVEEAVELPVAVEGAE